MSAAGGDRELRLAARAIKTARTHVEQAAFLFPGGPETREQAIQVMSDLYASLSWILTLRRTRNLELGSRRKAKRRAA